MLKYSYLIKHNFNRFSIILLYWRQWRITLVGFHFKRIFNCKPIWRRIIFDKSVGFFQYLSWMDEEERSRFNTENPSCLIQCRRQKPTCAVCLCFLFFVCLFVFCLWIFSGQIAANLSVCKESWTQTGKIILRIVSSWHKEQLRSGADEEQKDD